MKKNQTELVHNFVASNGRKFDPKAEQIVLSFIQRNKEEQEVYFKELFESNRSDSAITKLLDLNESVGSNQNEKSPIEKSNRLKTLFLIAKKNALEWLNNTPISNEAKQNIKARIENLTLITHSTDEPPNPFGGYGLCDVSFNAFYTPNEGTISICSEYAELPTQTIEHVFYHEIAHSIGPCNLSKNSGKLLPDLQVSQKHPFKDQMDCLKNNFPNEIHSVSIDAAKVFHQNNFKIYKDLANSISNLTSKQWKQL